jgi:hypothetical protein
MVEARKHAANAQQLPERMRLARPRDPTVLALKKIATALGIEPGRVLDRR